MFRVMTTFFLGSVMCVILGFHLCACNSPSLSDYQYLDFSISSSSVGEGSCEKTWVSFGSSCYKFFPTTSSYQEARSRCFNIAADLVVVSSQEENDFLYYNNPFRNLSRAMLLGITDEEQGNHFFWVDTGECSQYTNFRNSEPNNYESGGDCVTLSPNNNDWNDVQCTSQFSFVCERNLFIDTEAPSYGSTCPDDIHLLIKPNKDSVSVPWQPPVWTDDSNCFSSTSNSHYPGHILEIPNGSIGLRVTVTYNATDMVGRTSTCSFEIAASYEKSCINCKKKQRADGTFYCACAPGFRGLFCEIKNTTVDDAPTGAFFCGEDWVSFESSCYTFFSTKKSWKEARGTCLELGADLVVVSSQEENDFLYYNSSVKGGAIFIGYTDEQDENNFTWVDTGECSQYTNFFNGEPNNAGSGEDCVQLGFRYSDEWNGVACTREYSFVCEQNYFIDTEPPSYGSTCPDDIHRLIKPNKNSVSVLWEPPVWTDDSNCISSTSNSHYPGHVIEIPNGSRGLMVTVTYNATDMAGRMNTCSFKIAASYERSCVNGEQKQEINGTFVCECALGFSGLLCEINNSKSAKGNPSTVYQICISVAGCVIIIFCVSCLIFRKSKNKKREINGPTTEISKTVEKTGDSHIQVAYTTTEALTTSRGKDIKKVETVALVNHAYETPSPQFTTGPPTPDTCAVSSAQPIYIELT